MDCYNFIQLCKYYFSIFGCWGGNWVTFITIFLKEEALNKWQEHKQKKKTEILLPHNLAKLKIFL